LTDSQEQGTDSRQLSDDYLLQQALSTGVQEQNPSVLNADVHLVGLSNL